MNNGTTAMEDLNQQTINPWKHIFLHPKETIEWVLENNPEQFYRKLFFISGIFTFLILLLDKSPKTGQYLFKEPLLLFIIIGPFIALTSLYAVIYIGTAITNWLSKLLGDAEVSFKTAKEILIWANYPTMLFGIGIISFGFIIHNILNLNIVWFSLSVHLVKLFYDMFIYANIFRALYKFSKLKSYLVLAFIYIPCMLLYILLAFFFPKLL